MTDQKYWNVTTYCEDCFDKFGDTHLGMGWTKTATDAERRHQVMLNLLTPFAQEATLLDFGCGTAQLYDFIRAQGFSHIHYSGVDLSARFVEIARAKHPQIPYYCLDILTESATLPAFDYVIISGVFTAKFDHSFDEMFDHFRRIIRVLYSKTRRGLAFNTMSKQVEWERDDLFHLPFDTLANFLTQEISRHFVIRHDYRLYEYTTYVYR